VLKDTQYKRGMIVECLDSRLGTISGVGGDPSTPVLEVRPDKRQGSKGPLRIPHAYIAQTLENTVLLNISCEEAERIGRDTPRRAAASAPTMAVEQPAPTPPAAPRAATVTPVPAPSGAALAGQAAQPLTGQAPGQLAGQSLTMPLIEESLVPVKSWQEAGALELRKTTRTVQQELDVPVRYEEATVERVPLQRVLDEADHPAPRQDGDTLIVPIVHEEIVVVRRRVLVEELRITKRVQTRTEHISEPVQREEISISHEGLEAQTGDSPDPV
jgi:uncharacterized protein (TIGR02271 family)